MSAIAIKSPQLSTDAHVLLCRTLWADDPALLDRYRAIVDPTERARLSRFRFARDRVTFLVSHALVRTALSLYAPVPPQAWRFRVNKYGRPEISAPADGPPLRFNLSHTHGLAACVITRSLDAGIDVEARDRADDIVSVAARFFAPCEAAAVRSAPARRQMDQFLSTWTLKESYIKARGAGLSLPLDHFSFRLRGKFINVHFDPDLQDRPENWSFTLMRPTPEHWLALALRREQSTCHPIMVRWCVPLVGMRDAEAAPAVVAVTPGRSARG